jgi:hypothetical protein
MIQGHDDHDQAPGKIYAVNSFHAGKIAHARKIAGTKDNKSVQYVLGDKPLIRVGSKGKFEKMGFKLE